MKHKSRSSYECGASNDLNMAMALALIRNLHIKGEISTECMNAIISEAKSPKIIEKKK